MFFLFGIKLISELLHLTFLWVQIGIIGGSGLDDPDILEGRTERYVDTPYGKVSSYFAGVSV